MKLHTFCFGLLGSVLVLGPVACGAGGAGRDGGRAAAPRGPLGARSNRGSTPPAGSMSAGTMTRPMVMGQSVPITNLDVQQFPLTPEGASAPVTADWAYDPATMRNYIWYTQNVDCPSTAAPAAAGVILEINADGSGGFLLATECPDLNLAGCQFDAAGNATTCGACSITADGLVICVQ